MGVLRTTAQDQKFHFGLKVSPTLAWLKPDTEGLKKDGSKLGFSYGIITEFNFQENYAVASGVQVTYRGGKLKADGGSSTATTLKYIELPISLKMKTNELVDKFRFFGQFGFVPGLNISAKSEGNDVKDETKAFNAAMLIAIGSEYTVSGNTVLLGSLEFNNGFTDISKSGDTKVITNFFALNVGVLF